MDVAASASASDKVNVSKIEEENSKNEGYRLKKVLESFACDYPLKSIKDPFGSDELELYSGLTKEVQPRQVEIIGVGLMQLKDLSVHYSNLIMFFKLIKNIALLIGFKQNLSFQLIKSFSFFRMYVSEPCLGNDRQLAMAFVLRWCLYMCSQNFSLFTR